MAADDPKSIGDSRGPYNKLRLTCFANLIFLPQLERLVHSHQVASKPPIIPAGVLGNNQVRKVSFPSKGAIILSCPNKPLIQECIVLHQLLAHVARSCLLINSCG